MKQFIFDAVSTGDAQFICEYPSYKALRQEGFSQSELRPSFEALRGGELVNHYEYNGKCIAEVK